MPLYKRAGIWKFGGTQNIQTTDLPIDMSPMGTDLYPFQDVPIKLKASSSNAADVNIPRAIEGLNQNGLISIEQFTLNGVTPVDIPGRWYRQYRMYPTADKAYVGNVYAAEDGDTYNTPGVPDTFAKTKIKMLPEFQETTMLVFTTPRDWVSKVTKTQVNMIPKNTSAAYCTVGIFFRSQGGVFRCGGYVGLITSGSSFAHPTFEEHDEVPPLTDIVMRVLDISANGVEVTASFYVKRFRKLQLPLI